MFWGPPPVIEVPAIVMPEKRLIHPKKSNFILTPLIGFGAGGGSGPLTATFIGAAGVKSSPADPVTWAAASIGTASNDRYVVVGITAGADAGGGDAGFSGATVTVGGQSCSLIASNFHQAGGSSACISLWITDAPVTSGTTANIVLSTYTEASVAEANAIVYTITGASVIALVDSASDTTFPAAPVTASLNISAGGCGIGVYVTQVETSISWTGLDVTDLNSDIGVTQISSAHMNTLTAQSLTVTATSSTKAAMALGSWVGA